MGNSQQPDALLTTAAVAPMIGMTETALIQARKRGAGPRFVRVGVRGIRYQASAVAAYVSGADPVQKGDSADSPPGSARLPADERARIRELARASLTETPALTREQCVEIAALLRAGWQEAQNSGGGNTSGVA